jgi:hypothetical protein
MMRIGLSATDQEVPPSSPITIVTGVAVKSTSIEKGRRALGSLATFFTKLLTLMHVTHNNTLSRTHRGLKTVAQFQSDRWPSTLRTRKMQKRRSKKFKSQRNVAIKIMKAG